MSKFIEVKADTLGRDVIEIRSLSNPEVLYRVDTVNGRCSCPAWKFARNGTRGCKHLKAMGIASYQSGQKLTATDARQEDLL
jgi:predicted nucleic acid-binding Zn finger protein